MALSRAATRGPQRSRTHGRGFLLLALVLLSIAPVVLPTLAYATPPDSLWIPGVYDDADCDDVVTLATSVVGDIAPVTAADVGHNPPLIGSITRPVQAEPDGRAGSAVHSRDPCATVAAFPTHHVVPDDSALMRQVPRVAEHVEAPALLESWPASREALHVRTA